MHRSVSLLLAAALPAFAACSQEMRADAATAASGAQAAAPAEGAPWSTSARAGGVLLDFRGPVLPRRRLPQDEQRALAALVDAASGPDVAVTSRVDGAFTAPGRRQQAIVVVPGGASTLDPFPKPAIVAVLEQGKVVARHSFAEGEGNWQWILEAEDIDGDGLDELLLASGWMQMGATGKSLLLASLAGGRYRQVQVLENVARDDCQAGREAGGGKARAAVVSVRQGKLVQARYEAPCPRDAGKEGWAEGPKPQDYRPVDD